MNGYEQCMDNALSCKKEGFYTYIYIKNMTLNSKKTIREKSCKFNKEQISSPLISLKVENVPWLYCSLDGNII